MTKERFINLVNKYRAQRLDQEPLTPKERILAALNCQVPDRVPVCLPGFNLYEWADDSYALVLEQIARLGDPIYDVYLGFEPLVRLPDDQLIVNSLPNGKVIQTVQTPKGKLTQILSPFNGQTNHPNRVKHWVETIEDVDLFLNAPQLSMPRYLSHIKMDEIALNDFIPTIVTINEPMECINGLMGTTNFCLWSLEHPDLIQTVLDNLFEQIIKELTDLVQHDWDPVYRLSGCEMTIPPLMSLPSYQKYSQPYQKKLIDLIHSYGHKVIVHSHSKVSKLLPIFKDLDAEGTDPCEPPPIGDVDLAEAKIIAAGKISLWGNVEYTELTNSDENRIRHLVKEAIAKGGHGGGFVLMTCARIYEASIDERTVKNMICYLETGREFGNYPLSSSVI